jgi:hypothetical protein
MSKFKYGKKWKYREPETVPRWDPSTPGAKRFGVAGEGPYHIYVLYDLRTKVVKYVGVTRDVKQRLSEHLNKDHGNRLLRIWKSSLTEDNKFVIMALVDSAKCYNWSQAEKSWIRYYRSLGFIFNIHEGGTIEENEPIINSRPRRRPPGRKKTIPEWRVNKIIEAQIKAQETLDNNPKLKQEILNNLNLYQEKVIL